MSATNRKSKRIPSDFYQTPNSAILSFLDNYDIDFNYLTIYEPCAGNGSICKVIKEKYPSCTIFANEIREEERDNLKKYAKEVSINNFLEVNNLKTDVIISNPPYSMAQEIIEHCFKISNDGSSIIMLLRLAFLESKKRYKFWKQHPLHELYVLSERPSFTGKGTDATAYAWFVWHNLVPHSYNKQIIDVI